MLPSSLLNTISDPSNKLNPRLDPVLDLSNKKYLATVKKKRGGFLIKKESDNKKKNTLTTWFNQMSVNQKANDKRDKVLKSIGDMDVYLDCCETIASILSKDEDQFVETKQSISPVSLGRTEIS